MLLFSFFRIDIVAKIFVSAAATNNNAVNIEDTEKVHVDNNHND